MLAYKTLMMLAGFDPYTAKPKPVLKYSPDQARDNHGMWTVDGGEDRKGDKLHGGAPNPKAAGKGGNQWPELRKVDISKASKTKNPPIKKWQAPPLPKDQNKGAGKSGGGTATDHDLSTLGDLGEHVAVTRLGLTSLVGHKAKNGESQRQGALDAMLPGTNIAFEIKACSVSSGDYKIGAKKSEIADKRAAADYFGYRGAVIIPVVDTEKMTMHFYWKPGLNNGSIARGGKLTGSAKSWNYWGSFKYTKADVNRVQSGKKKK